MAFRAVHANWGTVFAHLPDLGCDQSWEAVWKVKPPAPIACAECRHPMHAKISYSGLRFFAHAPHAPDCEIARQGESEAHHLLKLELASAARDAGAHAELEVRAPDGSWRADVLATDPAGTWRMALEAQLSPITAPDITARTERMREDGVTSCWFSDRPRPPWLGAVPSVRLAMADGGGLVVAEGLVKFTGSGWGVPPGVSLTDFLRWVFTGKVLPHAPLTRLRYPLLRQLEQVWTAPQYATAEDAYLVEEAKRQRELEEQRARFQAKAAKKRAETDKKNAASRRAALDRATAAEAEARRLHDTPSEARWQAQLMTRRGVRQAVEHLAREDGITATAGLSITDRRWAGGTPLIGEDGVPVAVLAPESGLVNGEAFRLLAGMLLLFETVKDAQRFDRNTRRRRKVPIDGWRMAYIETPAPKPAEKAVPTSAVPRCRRAGGPCTCPEPELSVTISGRPHLAKPADRVTPVAALYTASCSRCGGPYDKPWRRTS
ncbi:competence protein CoiA family protein [Streptomyces sp. NBC_01221]|uniref:competence protein CoiA family protein n=1 Tax=Streptomyces sp. NBC_01221 TaxID=2903782 RepID=UPI0022572019|nr:competence protein CoiA family protein [Streptomyces sp. NBC_01221]MCX4791926.1 competence protein CoiA family protein [Streptomyces sp. NBC_01221]